MLIKLLLVLAPMLLLLRSAQVESGPQIPTQAYYTIDDGQTWFADEIDKIPPFEKDGKPAYRVHIFRCGKGAPFASHLERYTADAKGKLEQARLAGPGADPGLYEEVMMSGIEVKKPGTGEGGWVRQSDFARASEIMSPLCPDGTTNNIEPVYP